MAKSSNQKLKLLYLLRYLMQHSDENHPVSTPMIIAELTSNGISAERKSIYDDIEALRSFGIDIVQLKGKSGGYYIGERDFELPELKLLVDSVQSSKFITQDKTYKLIKKIESLASEYDGQLLQRQVFVTNRVKSMNESIYYAVDVISDAVTPLTELQTLAFAIQEMALYLDTHRDDAEALALYRQYQRMYADGKRKYEEMCGPLNHMHPGEGSYRWLDDPWPWEYGKNKEV